MFSNDSAQASLVKLNGFFDELKDAGFTTEVARESVSTGLTAQWSGDTEETIIASI